MRFLRRIKINKNMILIGIIFIIIFIVGCVVKVQKPTLTTPSIPAKETVPVPASTPTSPSTSAPSITAPATSTSDKKITELAFVKCDGTNYSITVKPNHELLEISLPVANKQKILDLKSGGLIDEIVETAENDGASILKRSFAHGSDSFLPNWAILVADIKTGNQETVYSKVKERSQSYGIMGLTTNDKEQDITFDYTCKVIVPKNTGRITLYSNIPEASFTVSGPASYTGSGTCWTKFDAPAGEYTIIWNDVAGYTAPGRIKGFASITQPQIKMPLSGEGHLKLGGTYKLDTPANIGTIIVITNLPEATFTITGPVSYSGSGTCWSQTNVPFGKYEVNFNDIAGYEIPFSFDKRKTVFISSGFSLGTGDVEYKKIGEQT